MTMLQLFCDGATIPTNPGGVSTYGWVAYEDHVEIARDSGFVCEGPGSTNNVAEYAAVIWAITWLWNTQRTANPVEICSDSQLIIRQLQGDWQVSSNTLRPHYERARRGLRGLAQWSLRWVPREQNIRADELSRAAYRAHVAEHGTECVGWRTRRRDLTKEDPQL